MPTPPAPSTTDARLAAIFPSGDPGRRNRRRNRVAVAAATVLALTGGGIAAATSSGSETLRYRTAVVATHDVESSLRSVGTVEPVERAVVAFPVAGTVDRVSVAVGDRVEVGTDLAGISTVSLERTVHVRQAALAQAELTLAAAVAAPTSTTVPTTNVPTTNVPTTAIPPSATPTGAAATDPATADARQAVVDAQEEVDATMATSTAALDSADTVCADDVDPTPDPTAASCRTALRDVLTAQTATAQAQSALSTAANHLDELVAATTTAATSSSATQPAVTASAPSTGTPNTSPANTSPANTRTTNAGTTNAVSSEQLIALQKAVDAAAVDLIVATHELEQAHIAAPLSGTVVGVGLAVGDSVTAASTTQAITIVGPAGFEVTTSVAVDKIPTVAVGQSATVFVDGSDDALTGSVIAIGASPDAASTTGNYRVTIGLTGSATDALRDGATASVSIVTKATSTVLAVPTSAVSTVGDRHTVQVVRDGVATEATIGVGVVGGMWTEVTSGLEAGQEVVLADLDAALPGAATAATSGSDTTGPVTLPGGAGGRAGFPAGAFPAGFGPGN